jgi:hypothetical protein
MRFMKSVMAIAAIATMLTMTGIARRRRKGQSRDKRRGLRRVGHS